MGLFIFSSILATICFFTLFPLRNSHTVSTAPFYTAKVFTVWFGCRCFRAGEISRELPSNKQTTRKRSRARGLYLTSQARWDTGLYTNTGMALNCMESDNSRHQQFSKLWNTPERCYMAGTHVIKLL